MKHAVVSIMCYSRGSKLKKKWQRGFPMIQKYFFSRCKSLGCAVSVTIQLNQHDHIIGKKERSNPRDFEHELNNDLIGLDLLIRTWMTAGNRSSSQNTKGTKSQVILKCKTQIFSLFQHLLVHVHLIRWHGIVLSDLSTEEVRTDLHNGCQIETRVICLETH